MGTKRNMRSYTTAERTVLRHYHRAQARGSDTDFTAAQWEAVCAVFGHQCLACGATSSLTVDHVVPLCKGGSNTITNLQPLCRSCNSRKGQRIIDYRDAAQLVQVLEVCYG